MTHHLIGESLPRLVWLLDYGSVLIFALTGALVASRQQLDPDRPAERAHVAQTALRSSVRRGSGPSHGARTLGEALTLAFARVAASRVLRTLDPEGAALIA